MTGLIRLIWKEYRALRGLWLALALFGLACDALIFFLANNQQERLSGWFSFAGVLPAGFALGAGAMLFALEREEATHEFLRCLPITSPRVFASKVLTAVVGTLLLATLLVVVTLDDVREIAIRPIENRGMLLGAVDMTLVYALLVVQAIGWSVFFSLQSARPLLAALLGALGAVTCISLVHYATESLGFAKLHGTWDAPALHLVATLAIWTVDVWLGSRWLHGRRRFEQLRRADVDPLRAYKRLLWQEWRGSRRLLAAIVVLGMIVPLAIWPALILSSVLGFALLGACTFLGDQEARQFRFFAERGTSPRRLWLSRQMFWGGAVLALAAFLFLAQRLLAVFVLRAALPDEPRRLWEAMGWVFEPLNYVIWVGLAFAVGQACSMFFQSGVLAATLGVVLAGLLAGWMTFMHSLDISLWWSAAPLLVAFVASTWLRSTGWLLERHTWRTWAPALLVPAITIATLLVSVPAYRVWEIPDPVTSVEVSPPSPPSAEARIAASRLERLCESLHFPKYELLGSLHHPGDDKPNADESQWLNKNEEALNAAIAAIDELPADATVASGLPLGELRWGWLGAMILRSGEVAERDGSLDEAWRRYQSVFRLAAFVRRENAVLGEVSANNLVEAAAMQLTRWGARKGQTVANLRTAIADLRRSEAEDQSLAEVVSNEYVAYIEAIDELIKHPTDDPRAVIIAKWAPWEIARLRRLYRYMASLNLLDARDADAAFTGRAALRVKSPHEREFALVSRLWQTTLMGPFFEANLVAQWRCSAVCYRRAALLVLGVEAWRWEHGSLPEKLSDLQGPSFDALPVDPYNNRPFEWVAWGLSVPARSYNGEEIAAGRPFIYSVGPDNTQQQAQSMLERLRRRSADEPIERARPLSGDASAAAAPSGAGPAPPMILVAPGGVPAANSVEPSPIAEETTEYLAGLVFPVPE